MTPDTLSTLSSQARLSAIIDHLGSLPSAQRAADIQAISRNLAEPEATRLNYAWYLHARDSQLPPEEDWDTWRKLTWPSDAITPIIQITRITVQTTPTHQPILPILTSCKS